MPCLVDLPSELISSIFSYLEKQDIFSARQTSKHLESSSLSYFGRTFFRKKGYLITGDSIKVLKSIACHQDLRKHVQHVWFNPDCYTFATPPCAQIYCPSRPPQHDGNNPFHGESLHENELYQACLLDHRNLLNRFQLERELATVFANLPNLHVIGMRRSEHHSPWGWQRLEKSIGADPRVLGPIPTEEQPDLSGSTLLFMAIINSLFVSRTSVQRFYIDVIDIDNIRPEFLPQEKLDVALRSLRYLEINASKARLDETCLPSYAISPDKGAYGEGLLKILNAAPHLLELGLQIFPDLKQKHLLPPRPWRESYPYIAFQKLRNHDSLRNLTRLKLEKITTDPYVLQGFIEPAKSTLQSLKMRTLRLLTTTTKDDGEETKFPWQVIFEFLRDHCQSLSYILLHLLMHECGGVSFTEHARTPGWHEGRFGSTDLPDDLPPFIQAADGGLFTMYENVALEVSGKEEVAGRLAELVERHWYQRPMFSYEMDDSLWYTDTSDEEW